MVVLSKHPWTKPLGGLVIAAAAVYWGSPIWAVAAFSRAVAGNDAATVNAMVDFPALRASLNREAQRVALYRLTGHSEPGSSLVGGLAVALMAPIVAPIVAELVNSVATPAGIQSLLDHQAKAQRQSSDSQADGMAQLRALGQMLTKTSVGYRSWNSFGVTLHDRRSQALGLTFARRGFVGWQLVALDLPADGTFNP